MNFASQSLPPQVPPSYPPIMNNQQEPSFTIFNYAYPPIDQPTSFCGRDGVLRITTAVSGVFVPAPYQSQSSEGSPSYSPEYSFSSQLSSTNSPQIPQPQEGQTQHVRSYAASHPVFPRPARSSLANPPAPPPSYSDIESQQRGHFSSPGAQWAPLSPFPPLRFESPLLDSPEGSPGDGSPCIASPPPLPTTKRTIIRPSPLYPDNLKGPFDQEPPPKDPLLQ